MEGLDALGGDVRLGSFIEKLAALKAALAETAHLLAAKAGGSVDFLVSDLSHNSPAMVEVTAIASSPTAKPAVVVNEFLSFVAGVRDREVEALSSQAKLVGHLRKLAAGTGERIERLWIDGPGVSPIVFDAAVAKALDDALPDVRREIGSVKGVVKRYSGVGKQPYFKIVPPVGGFEIKCVFPADLLEKAAASVEHNATVEGELKSYEDDLWPHEIKVRAIEIHPIDDALPRLSELANVAPSATGEQSVAEFVRGLRNEW